MALAAWSGLAERLPEGAPQAIVASGISLVLAILVYVVLRRQVRGSHAEPEVLKRRGRLLALVLLIALLLVLLGVWSGFLFGTGEEDPGSRAADLVAHVLWTLGIGTIIYLLVATVRQALVRKESRIEVRHKVRVATAWVGAAVFAFALAFIWVGQVGNLGVFFGIVGAGLALAFQETLLCMAGWMVLVVRRPYDLGDRIEIDGRIGDIIDISVLHTTLLEVGAWVRGDQSTGRMLIIPNGMLFRHPLHNYTKGFPFIWNELTVTVTFESDWEEAERLMLEKAEVEAERTESEVGRRIKDMQFRYAIRYERLTPIVYTTIAPGGVDLTLRYLSPVRERRATTHRISRNILHAFLGHPRIDFAYPTTRIFRNNEEGKPGTGGPAAGDDTGEDPRPV